MVEFVNGLWLGDPQVGDPVQVTLLDINGGVPFVVTLDGRNIWDLVDEFVERNRANQSTQPGGDGGSSGGGVEEASSGPAASELDAVEASGS